jgi:hypothetical protein
LLIGGGVGKDNREVDDFCHDTVSVSAIPCRVVIRRGKRNMVLRCLVWIETTSSGQSEIELAGQQVDDGREVSG